MYDIPSNEKIVKCIVTADTVINKSQPTVIIDENRKREVPKQKRKVSSTNKKETA